MYFLTKVLEESKEVNISFFEGPLEHCPRISYMIHDKYSNISLYDRIYYITYYMIYTDRDQS